MSNQPDILGSASRHFSGVSLNSTLVAALAAIALAGIVVLTGAASVFSSAFAGSIHDGQPKEVLDKLVADHDAQIKQYQERFKNRYVFFKPPPPPPPVQRTENRPPPPPPVVDNTPKVPATYPGPSIAWVIGSDVYFNLSPPTATEKYMRIAIGEERNGVKVINLDKMPRTVRVGHSGGEYDVKVFGDSTSTNSLFPTTPRPSVLTPGFIPADGPAPAAVSVANNPDDEPADDENPDDADADAEANAEAHAVTTETPKTDQPASSRHRAPPGRGDNASGEGRRRPREAGQRPRQSDEEAPRRRGGNDDGGNDGGSEDDALQGR